MVDPVLVNKINAVIETFFANNASVTIVPAKELMPAFISAGIFTKDHRKGLPIRKVLKALDETNQLSQIPFAYAERKEENTYWYFIPSDNQKPTTPYKQSVAANESKPSTPLRIKNDETYVINLCDKVLGKRALRQKKFEFIEGDLHKNGKTKTKLPVDAFYEELQLVVEYRKEQSLIPDKNIKRREKTTVSGVNRDEQRIRYNKRVDKALLANGINLICIPNSSFTCDAKNRIIRSEENDLKTVEKALKKYCGN